MRLKNPKGKLGTNPETIAALQRVLNIIESHREKLGIKDEDFFKLRGHVDQHKMHIKRSLKRQEAFDTA